MYLSLHTAIITALLVNIPVAYILFCRCKRCGALFKVERDGVLQERGKGTCPQCGLEIDAETAERMEKAFDSIAQLVQKAGHKNPGEAE